MRSLLLSLPPALAPVLLLSSPAVAATGGPDAFGYEYEDSDESTGPRFQWEELSGSGVALPLSDDDHEIVNMPFSFPFYGETYNSVGVNSNGALNFGGSRWTTFGNGCMPSTSSSMMIAPFWDDLNPASGGEVLWEVRGTGDQQRLIVEWDAVPRYGTSEFQTFQVVLFASGVIEYRYETMTNTGASATVGIQNGNTEFLQYGCNPSVVFNGQAIRFRACEDVDRDGDGFTDCEECDDRLDNVYPGAPDDCDGLDNDCNGIDGVDIDGDGYTVCTRDCDETRADVNPGVREIHCNGFDEDCDPWTEDEPDLDQDGFGRCSDDCDDDQPLVNPNGVEVVCNGMDDDCNPATDDDADADGDGYFACREDCDDANPLVNPGQTEIDCNGVDDDCDFATPEAPDLDADANSTCDGDCNDDDPRINAIRAEKPCNGIDDDCDPSTGDEPDKDGDGISLCAVPIDCDDDNAGVFPGNTEVTCNDIDDDCDRSTVDDEDRDRDAWSICAGDCDDNDSRLSPEEEDRCDDGIDNNCDGVVDENCDVIDPEDPIDPEGCGCSGGGSSPMWLAIFGVLGLRRRR